MWPLNSCNFVGSFKNDVVLTGRWVEMSVEKNQLFSKEQTLTSARKHIDEHYHRRDVIKILIGHEFVFVAPFHFCGSTENQHFPSKTEAGYQSAQTASKISQTCRWNKKSLIFWLQHLAVIFTAGFTRGCCSPPAAVMHNYSFNMMPHKDDLERWRIWWKALNRN